jgi:hypothetical protein
METSKTVKNIIPVNSLDRWNTLLESELEAEELSMQDEEAPLDDYSNKTIAELAMNISKDWSKNGKINNAAKPYIQAMYSLRSIEDTFYLDTGTMIVSYFLSNASSWKGKIAKAIKQELRKRLKEARN